MTLNTWLEQTTRDADLRGLAALRPLLEGLARATAALRAADWNTNLSGTAPPPSTPK
jgi:hypothetical protein